MNAAVKAIQLPTHFDLSRYVPIDEAAAMLEMDAGHLRRRCREELAAKGLAVLIVPPEGGAEQWFVLREWNPRLIGGATGQLYADPDLSAFTLKQQQDARSRRICVEDLRKARREWPGRMCDWMPTLLEQLRRQFADLNISRTQLLQWDASYRRPADLTRLVDSTWRRSAQPGKPRSLEGVYRFVPA